jgi:probable rRNA maturation factor
MKRRPFQLSITAEAGGNRYIPFLQKNVRKAHRFIRQAPNHVSILIANDATMSRLHQQFLKIARTTDVLTFEIERSSKGRVDAGEIIVCLPEARRQARERKIPVSQELLLYAVHGLLHLAGYDDVKPGDYDKMHWEEDRILTAIGIGPTFVPTAQGD